MTNLHYRPMAQSYTFDATRYKLGTLCKRGHAWPGTAQSLRRKGKTKDGVCLECEKLHIVNRDSTEEKRNKRVERQKEWMREHRKIVRAEFVAQGLTTRGTKPIHRSNLEVAIERAGQCPSVAQLVMAEQRRYWRENPELKTEHDRQWSQANWWLQYQINPELRIRTREKSKRRKARIREQTAHQIKPAQLITRFNLFNNRCAYCEALGDLHIEHVVPISKGGTHALGNIVPACSTCNFSKRDKEVEQWYKAQTFFTRKRWDKICSILGWNKSSIGQLALL